MRLTFLIFVLLLIFSGQNPVAAADIFQTPENDQYLNKYFTTKNGLPQNTPVSMVQTRDGYLWIATFGGLARFDGVKFTVFTTSGTPNLINNRLTALYEDANGVLWIGSEDGDVMSYQNGLFSVIRKSAGLPVDSTITSFYADQNGVLWIGDGLGFKTYQIKTGEMKTFDESVLPVNSTPFRENFTVFGFAADTENNLWMASSRGLIRFRDGQFTRFGIADGLPEYQINSVKTDSHGTLWILSRHNFGQYSPGKFTSFGQFTAIRHTSPLIIDKNDRLFFVVDQISYEVSGGLVKTADFSVVTNSLISSLLWDSEQNLWIGTDDHLIQLKKRHIQVFSYRENKKSLPVSAITEDLNGTVWASSFNMLIRSKNGKLDLLKISPPSDSSYTASLAVDRNNTLWIGGLSGVSRLINDRPVDFDAPNLFRNHIGVLFFDHSGVLWIGSQTDGLQTYAGGAVTTYTTRQGLVNNSVARIFEDSRGVLWIGTHGGLSRLENGVFTNFTVENGLTNNSVREIYEDADGTLWIGTYGGGLMRYRDGVFVPITKRDGLAEDIASRILTDDRDNFWIMGNQGIYKVSRQSLNDFADGKIKNVFCEIYDEADGMEVGEGNGGSQPAGVKTSDGKLWFPMVRGGIIIDPVRTDSPPPPVYIESIFLNEKETAFDGSLTVQPEQNNLEINYTAVELNKPEQIQFRYQLEGFDDGWQEVGSRRTAYYPNLPPGDYTFTVTTAGAFVPNRSVARLKITVFAPFWRTKWFYALGFLFVTGLLVAAYRFQLRRLEIQKSRQQEFSRQLINAHESERFRIAAELHDSLGQQLLIIKNWSLLALKKLGRQTNAESQIREISETASQALQEIRNISHNLRPNHLQRFGLTETLENMIRQIEQSSHIHFTIEIADIDNLFGPESELSIYRIVQESLTNIVKHSKAAAAAVKISHAGEKIEIIIRDEGKGFDVQAYRVGENKNFGFGLANIIQRSELLGGNYTISSNSYRGTEIQIILPIDAAENEKSN